MTDTALRDRAFERRLSAQRSPWLWIAAAFAALVTADQVAGFDPRTDPAATAFLLAITAGLTLAAWAVQREAPKAAVMIILLFVGGGAQLSLIDPAFFISLRLAPKGGLQYAWFALVAIEAAGTGLALAAWSRRETIRHIHTALGLWRPLVMLALAAFCSVSLMRYLRQGDLIGYGVHLAAGALFALVSIGNLVALLSAPDLPRLLPGPGALAWLDRSAPRALPILAVLLSTLLALAVFRGNALVEDETAYVFQARTFAAHALTAPPPKTPGAAFGAYLIEETPHARYAVTAPGWPAMLAIGLLLRIPLLVNPLLAGFSVWGMHRLVARLRDRETANLAALLMVASPWFLFTSGSLMTHALSLALTVGAWLALLAARDRTIAGADDGARLALPLALLAGMAMGWLFLTRALEGLTIGSLTGLWALWQFGRARRPGLVLAYAIGCVLVAGLIAPYDMALTGHPLLTPQDAYIDRLWGPGANAFGFGPKIGPPGGWGGIDLWPGYTPLEGVVNTQNYLVSLSLELFGWPWSSLLLVCAGLFWPARDGLVRAMTVLFAAIVAVHFCYWFTATFYIGPRYWYGAFPAIVVIAACGFQHLAARLEAAGVTTAAARLRVMLAIAALYSLTVFLPIRAATAYLPRGERGVAVQDIERQSRAVAGGGAIVLLPCPAMLKAAVVRSDPFSRRGSPIFALDRGDAANAALIAAYPGRTPIKPGYCPPQP